MPEFFEPFAKTSYEICKILFVATFVRPIQERGLPCGVDPKLTRVVGIETEEAQEIIQTLERAIV